MRSLATLVQSCILLSMSDTRESSWWSVNACSQRAPASSAALELCSASPYWPLSKSSRAEGSAVLPDALVQRVAFGGAVAPVGLPGEVVAAVQGLGVGDVQTDAGELDHRGGVRAPRVSAQHRQPSLLRGVRRNLDHEEISRKQ